MSHVMLNTLVRNAHIASQSSNITCSTTATAKTATATKPASGCLLYTSDAADASVLAKNAGDAKIFNPATADTDAYFVVDAQGFELIELHFRAGSNAAANATLGEM